MDEQPGYKKRDPDTEGVRIIGAEEAAEAAERDDVAQRRPQDQPKFGDRPSQPDSQPKGPRPTLRFPLSDTSDATDIARPRVQPGPPPEPPQHRSLFAVEPGSAAGDDAAPTAATDGEPAPIPHWTEPATGEIPLVLGGDQPDDDRAWQAFSEGSPRWREQGSDYDERDDIALLGDEEPRLGALDPDSPAEDELLSFDDLDAPPVRRKAKAPSRAASAEGARRPDAAAPRPAGTRKAPGARPPAKKAPSGSRPRTARAGGPPSGGPTEGGRERDVPTAAAVGAALAVAAMILLKVGPGWAMLLVTPIVALAAAEFFTTSRRAGYQPAQLLGIAACVCLPLAAYWKGTAAFPVVLGLTTMAGFVWYIIGAGDEQPTMNLGVTMFGVMWIGVLGSFAGLLLGVPAEGASLLLATLLVAVANDVGGFFVGRSFGRAPLSPISPGKTVEGLFGGIVSSIVVSVLLVLGIGISPFGDSFGRAVMFGLVVGGATAVGDLCESIVKRDLGVKDMGNILPGHGGILDRMDGILFAMPAAWYLGLVMFA